MAGYSGYSKSNNAIDAEERGLMTASALAKKLGVTAALIEEHCEPEEWHHSSSWYNRVNYYDLDQPSNETILKMQRIHKENKAKAKAGGEIHLNCKVKWLEWSGSRNNPRCKEMCEFDAKVQVKGQTAYITFKNGEKLTKRLTTNGFSFEADFEKKEKARKEYECRERIRVKKRMAELTTRFKIFAKGNKFETCDYFEWRDDFKRDASKSEFKRISHKNIISELKSSGTFYAERFIQRLEEGEREIIRLGLYAGIRVAGKLKQHQQQ